MLSLLRSETNTLLNHHNPFSPAVHGRLLPSKSFEAAKLSARRTARQAFRQKEAMRSTEVQPKSVSQILPAMFVAGAIMGPLLDGIHGTVHLLDYKVGSYDILGLHSSFWVAPLLGTYYAIIGPLHTILDSLAKQGDPSQDGASSQTLPEILQPLEQALKEIFASPDNANHTRKIEDFMSGPILALNTGMLAVLLALSAVLYDKSVPYLGISGILGVVAFLNWKMFDGTRQGLALALLCGISAPLSELVLINVLGLWQYPHPDVFGSGGVPSWVFWCYFFYTPAVGNIARVLRK